jgi:transposase
MSEKLTVRQFFARFPTDDACLAHVMEVRYGLRHKCQACGQESTFHKLTERRAYSCAHCGDHVYPCAGTVFQDSRTALQTWFYAIYLFVVTRHGVSGKELERSLGVTYKCAWRMGQQIRKLMIGAEDFTILQGHIELDEAYVGGRRSGGKRGRGAPGKTIVFGMKERGGRMRTEVIPDVKKVTTNTVESFWKLFKASVRSTHVHVSAKYMDRYLGEFTFRSNHREMRNAMLDLLIAAV